jgi:hypothetical protein
MLSFLTFLFTWLALTILSAFFWYQLIYQFTRVIDECLSIWTIWGLALLIKTYFHALIRRKEFCPSFVVWLKRTQYFVSGRLATRNVKIWSISWYRSTWMKEVIFRSLSPESLGLSARNRKINEIWLIN